MNKTTMIVTPRAGIRELVIDLSAFSGKNIKVRTSHTNTVTPALKRKVVSLYRRGTSCRDLASSFGLTTQQVASFVAWDTMRRRR